MTSPQKMALLINVSKERGWKNNGVSKEVGSRRRGARLGGIHLDRPSGRIGFLGCRQGGKRRWRVVKLLGLNYSVSHRSICLRWFISICLVRLGGKKRPILAPEAEAEKNCQGFGQTKWSNGVVNCWVHSTSRLYWWLFFRSFSTWRCEGFRTGLLRLGF